MKLSLSNKKIRQVRHLLSIDFDHRMQFSLSNKNTKVKCVIYLQ